MKQAFEDLYQNHLWKKETLLAGSIQQVHQDLSILSQHFPLALVTGRPRKDLQRFLQHFELASFFTVSVCMEDAEAKPSPDPIKLALEKLSTTLTKNIKAAWMIGDTPDDILAAQRCRMQYKDLLLPLAIETSHQSTIDALQKAGCARMITSWRTCLDLLSLSDQRNTHV